MQLVERFFSAPAATDKRQTSKFDAGEISARRSKLFSEESYKMTTLSASSPFMEKYLIGARRQLTFRVLTGHFCSLSSVAITVVLAANRVVGVPAEGSFAAGPGAHVEPAT